MTRPLRGAMAAAILGLTIGRALGGAVTVEARRPSSQSSADRVAQIDAANAKRNRKNAKRAKAAK